MVIKLSTDYSDEEWAFIYEHGCEVLSEIKLPNWFNCAAPLRMFVYGGCYVGEIDDEDKLVWAVLSKFRGRFQWGELYGDLKALEDGL